MNMKYEEKFIILEVFFAAYLHTHTKTFIEEEIITFYFIACFGFIIFTYYYYYFEL